MKSNNDRKSLTLAFTQLFFVDQVPSFTTAPYFVDHATSFYKIPNHNNKHNLNYRTLT